MSSSRTSDRAERHDRISTSKVFVNLSQLSSEFAGRFAGVGYSDVVIASIVFGVGCPRRRAPSKIAQANSFHVVASAFATWNVPKAPAPPANLSHACTIARARSRAAVGFPR